MTRCFYAVLPLTMLILSACGGGPDDLPDDLVPVTGTIKLDGEPVPQATVVFKPQEGTKHSASAVTDEKGVYELVYSSQNNGIPPGEYTVTVNYGEFWEPTYPDGFDPDTAPASEKKKYETPPIKIPARYSEGGALQAEVKAGETNTIDFNMESGDIP